MVSKIQMSVELLVFGEIKCLNGELCQCRRLKIILKINKWVKEMQRIPSPEEVKCKHNAEIDIMKLIASITIMFHHSVYSTNVEASQIWAGGYMSVALFFCISGYLLAGSTSYVSMSSQDKLGRETVKFMLQKIKKILPYYIFGWAAAYIIVGICSGFGLIGQAKVLLNSIFPNLLIHMTGLDGFEVVGAVWYLSAMYLCMPVIYVLLRTKRDLFIWVFAPLLTLFLTGYMHKVYGGFGVVWTWTGFCYLGVIYAVAGLSCGCFCYGVSEWLRRQSLSKFSRILLSFLDFGIFILCLILMQLCPEGAMQATVSFFFAIVVIASFSEKSYTRKFFDRFCNTPLMGEFSIAIYLCHGRIYTVIQKFFPTLQSIRLRFLLYVMFSLLLSVLCVLVVRLVKRLLSKM